MTPAITVLVRDFNVIEINKNLGIFKKCYHYKRGDYIAKNCWYRGRETQYIKLELRKKDYSKI